MQRCQIQLTIIFAEKFRHHFFLEMWNKLSSCNRWAFIFQNSREVKSKHVPRIFSELSSVGWRETVHLFFARFRRIRNIGRERESFMEHTFDRSRGSARWGIYGHTRRENAHRRWKSRKTFLFASQWVEDRKKRQDWHSNDVSIKSATFHMALTVKSRSYNVSSRMRTWFRKSYGVLVTVSNKCSKSEFRDKIILSNVISRKLRVMTRNERLVNVIFYLKERFCRTTAGLSRSRAKKTSLTIARRFHWTSIENPVQYE